MARTNWGGDNEVLEMKFDNVDLPRTGDFVDLLEEWYKWYNTYGSLLGESHWELILDLYLRSEEALKKWGRVETLHDSS